jgi:hypothetical protein
MLGVKVSRRVESGSFVDIGHSLIIYVREMKVTSWKAQYHCINKVMSKTTPMRSIFRIPGSSSW